MSSKINILGVDDKPENLLALEAILEDPSINFLTAASGKEALDQLVENDVALILMDVMMPELDGYETAELIRGSKRTCHIPIIFITAVNTLREHFFKGYSSGAVDYLAKPIIPEILRSKISVFKELFQHKQVLKEKALQLESANHRIYIQKEALRESEVRFRSAFEQSFQFMAILDVQGRVLELNHLAQKLCGDYSGGLIGQYLWDVCWVGQEEENRKLKEVIEKAALGEKISDEAKFTDINGDIHHLFRTVSPVQDSNGKIACITVQGHDITERVKAESEKRNLEHLLQQAQKMEALGVLAGGIAHDFNNVLSVIIGNAELAKRYIDSSSEQHHFYKLIHTAAIKAKNLVSQILSFSRQAEIKKTVLQPAEIVSESVKLLRSSLPATIEIVADVETSCGAIFADPTQYHQIVMNLCTNAYHALEDKGGKLTVKLHQQKVTSTSFLHNIQLQPGEYAYLTVGDSGDGIRQSNLNRIFDPYFTTKEEGKGTGMGLSIVHGIVKGHGGAIDVETKRGVGTTFHVFLPLADKEGERNENDFQDLTYGNERILLVDDEELLLEMVKDMLEMLGYHVAAEKSSTEALNRFCDNPKNFDLIITDQTMPDLVGTDLARRALRVRPDIPIILSTGYSPNISRDSVIALGIKELAYKPLSLDEMSAVVRRVIDQAS